MYTISGFKVLNYTNKNNQQVNGVEFHLVSIDEIQERDFHGKSVLQIYLSSANINGSVQVGAKAQLCYSIVRGQPRVTGIKIS